MLVSGVARDLVNGAPRQDGIRRLFQNIWIARAARRSIIALDKQPIVAPLAGAHAHAYEMPASFQLLAMQNEIEMAFSIARMGISLGRPGAMIPDQNCAGAILSFWNRALESTIIKRMILDMDGQAFLARHEAWPARYRPTFQDAIEFEAEIIMQPRGSMFLHDEAIAGSARSASARLRRR